jgi:hypothetical protein
MDSAESVPTQTEHGQCEFCRGPLGPPKPRARKNQPRRFCRTACRAAWHHREQRARLARIIADLQASLARELDRAHHDIAVVLTERPRKKRNDG